MAEVIIFDMDGTLVDSGRPSILAMNRCAENYGLPILQPAAIIRAVGIANPEFYYTLYPDYDRDTVFRFGQEVEAAEEEYVKKEGESLAFEGILPLLASLQSMGKKLYLASTGDESHVTLCLSVTGMRRFFLDFLYGEPDKTEMLARILNRHPGETAVMIGDTQKDSDAAKRNSIPCIGAGYGYCFPDRHHLFDVVAHRASDLLALLTGPI